MSEGRESIVSGRGGAETGRAEQIHNQGLVELWQVAAYDVWKPHHDPRVRLERVIEDGGKSKTAKPNRRGRLTMAALSRAEAPGSPLFRNNRSDSASVRCCAI